MQQIRFERDSHLDSYDEVVRERDGLRRDFVELTAMRKEAEWWAAHHKQAADVMGYVAVALGVLSTGLALALML